MLGGDWAAVSCPGETDISGTRQIDHIQDSLETGVGGKI